MTKKPTLQNLKEQTMYTSYKRKRIIKAAKFYSQNLDGLARILFLPNNIITLFYISIIQQYLYRTQNWHQQDASASSDENASVHTPPTTSWHNSQASRI